MALITKHIHISGMSCINCQNRITSKLRATPGIKDVSVRYQDGTARIAFDPAVVTFDQIIKSIENLFLYYFFDLIFVFTLFMIENFAGRTSI